MMYWQERTDTSKSTFNPKIGTTPPSRWGQRQGLVVGEEILWDRILIDPSFYSLGQIRPGSIRQRLAVGVRVSNQIPNRNPTPRRHRCCCRHHSPHVFEVGDDFSRPFPPYPIMPVYSISPKHAESDNVDCADIRSSVIRDMKHL